MYSDDFLAKIVPAYCRIVIEHHPESDRLREYADDIAQSVALRLCDHREVPRAKRSSRLRQYLEDEIAGHLDHLLLLDDGTPCDTADTRAGPLEDLLRADADPSSVRSRLNLTYYRLRRDEGLQGADLLGELRLLLSACGSDEEDLYLRLWHEIDTLEHDAGARADPLSKSGLDKVYCRVTKDLPGRAANLDVTFLREIGIAEYDPRGYAKLLTK